MDLTRERLIRVALTGSKGDVILKDAEKKMILWGAGEVCGHILKNNIVKDVAFIVDNDPQKSGSLFHGIPVLHPSKITDWTSYKIIIAMNRKNGFTVADQLEQYGLKKWKDFEIWDYECLDDISENYSKNVYYDALPIEHKICSILKSGKPFAGGRLGHTECVIAYEYCRMCLGIQDSFSERWKQYLLTTSGFFQDGGSEKKDIERYAEMTISALRDMDMHFVWNLRGEAFLLGNYANPASIFINKGIVQTPWHEQGRTWMSGLCGKKVLVISPFSESIKVQYAKRKKLFTNENNLPDFNLTTYQSLETQMGDSKGFKDWFEAYQYMETEILQMEFDIAIVGCGAYGYPLTAAIKKAGKQAIEMCSSTQLMFGIKAKRWERENNKFVMKWWNDAWIYPLETPPQYYKEIEDGAYWG